MKSASKVWTAAAVAGMCLLSAGSKPMHAAGLFAAGGAPMPAGYVQERGWDAPPPELDEVRRRGFHDGIEGAHKDYDNHRRPDVNNRDEFRHPHVAERDREAYRDGYARGYQAGVEHLYHDHGRM
jgi:ribosome modulation factor